jgi:hypothetical protein
MKKKNTYTGGAPARGTWKNTSTGSSEGKKRSCKKKYRGKNKKYMNKRFTTTC